MRDLLSKFEEDCTKTVVAIVDEMFVWKHIQTYTHTYSQVNYIG